MLAHRCGCATLTNWMDMDIQKPSSVLRLLRVNCYVCGGSVHVLYSAEPFSKKASVLRPCPKDCHKGQCPMVRTDTYVNEHDGSTYRYRPTHGLTYITPTTPPNTPTSMRGWRS